MSRAGVLCHCGKPFVRVSGIAETCVGYFSPEGHDHDDNCRSRSVYCEDGHETRLSRRNRCPVDGCEWESKTTCLCHPGPKVDAWPLLEAEDVADLAARRVKSAEWRATYNPPRTRVDPAVLALYVVDPATGLPLVGVRR